MQLNKIETYNFAKLGKEGKRRQTRTFVGGVEMVWAHFWRGPHFVVRLRGANGVKMEREKVRIHWWIREKGGLIEFSSPKSKEKQTNIGKKLYTSLHPQGIIVLFFNYLNLMPNYGDKFENKCFFYYIRGNEVGNNFDQSFFNDLINIWNVILHIVINNNGHAI